MMKTPISPREIENLSAYLDGQLTEAERKRVEARLAADPELRVTFEGLRQTRALLKSLPKKRAPRNFTLTPKMVGIKPKRSLAPIFGWASAMATVLLLFVLFFDFMSVGVPGTTSVAYQNSAPQAEASTLAVEAPLESGQAEAGTDQFAEKPVSPSETESQPPEVMGSLDSVETSQAQENAESSLAAEAQPSPMEPEPSSPVITGPMGLKQLAPEPTATPSPTLSMSSPTIPPTVGAERGTLGEGLSTAAPATVTADVGGEGALAPATSSPLPTQIPEQVIVEAPSPTSEAVPPHTAASPPYSLFEIILAALALLSALVALILRRAAR